MVSASLKTLYKNYYSTLRNKTKRGLACEYLLSLEWCSTPQYKYFANNSQGYEMRAQSRYLIAARHVSAHMNAVLKGDLSVLFDTSCS